MTSADASYQEPAVSDTLGLEGWLDPPSMHTACQARDRSHLFGAQLPDARAQSISDRFATLPWVRILHAYAKKVNPLLGKLLGPMTYYWATAQAEYSTDIMFKDRKALEELMPRLLQHSLVSFNAADVMTFLGRKLSGNFKGELVSDLHECQLKGRPPGRRVKHRMKANWIKMYDKAGVVLRVETVINSPEEYDGRLAYRLKRPAPDGSTHLVLTPLDLLRLLAALVPPPRANLVHFHGLLAPNARLRPRVVPPPPPLPPPPSVPPPPATQLPPSSRHQRLPWAELLRRTFEHHINCMSRPGADGPRPRHSPLSPLARAGARLRGAPGALG